MPNTEKDASFPSFEEQFNSRKVLKCRGVEISVVDVVPQVSKGLPVFVGPRWLGSIADYEVIIRALNKMGRRVISAELEGDEDTKATQIDDILGQKAIEEADAISHSVGSISLLKEALNKVGLFRRIVLINAPLTGGEPVRDLIRRYAGLLKDTQPNGQTRTDRSGGVRKFYDMAREITSSGLWGKMRRIIDNGTEVLSISALSDTLFPPEIVEAEAKRHGFQIGEGVFFEEGGHLEINPFIPHVLQLINS